MWIERIQSRSIAKALEKERKRKLGYEISFEAGGDRSISNIDKEGEKEHFHIYRFTSIFGLVGAVAVAVAAAADDDAGGQKNE